MFLLELNPLQLAYLTNILDKIQEVSSENVLHHAGIRQQLSNPQLTNDVVARMKQQGVAEAAQVKTDA